MTKKVLQAIVVLALLGGVYAWQHYRGGGGAASTATPTVTEPAAPDAIPAPTRTVDSPPPSRATRPVPPPRETAHRDKIAPKRNDDAVIADAFRNERSDVMVESEGRVSRVLPDDDEGSRHQRFILRLANGKTVLIAHNIDLAPRVPLSEGDIVRFHGEYEWNDRGGVVHWTHHDPRGRHEGGWLELAGKRYE